MITIYNQEAGRTENEKEFITGEIRGLSTDDKPITIGDKYVENGTTFIEIDTGKIFLFDLDNEQWKEI